METYESIEATAREAGIVMAAFSLLGAFISVYVGNLIGRFLGKINNHIGRWVCYISISFLAFPIFLFFLFATVYVTAIYIDVVNIHMRIKDLVNVTWITFFIYLIFLILSARSARKKLHKVKDLHEKLSP